MNENRDCVRCTSVTDPLSAGEPVGEKFTFFGMGTFNIDKARQLVADGRPVREVPTAKLAEFTSYTGIPGKERILAAHVDEEHIDHVPDSKDDPVILAWSPKIRNKPRLCLPIDGHHRIARAVKHNQPTVYVVVLTEKETDKIFKKER